MHNEYYVNFKRSYWRIFFIAACGILHTTFQIVWILERERTETSSVFSEVLVAGREFVSNYLKTVYEEINLNISRLIGESERR